MNTSLFKSCVEFVNGSFIEHWINGDSTFYTVVFPSGIRLDTPFHSVAIRWANKRY